MDKQSLNTADILKTAQKQGFVEDKQEDKAVPCEGMLNKSGNRRGMNPKSQARRWGMAGGNKPGAKAQTEDQKKAMELVRKSCTSAVKVIAEIMANKKTRAADRLRAAEIILERTYGKAPAHIALESEDRSAILAEIRAELDKIKKPEQPGKRM